ncbi:glycoside hydrolase family 3 C-terminal domain-containing protein [Natronosporangium hydrolyticum]|uniref:Exo-alpha-(1->6)-L-arabinopyranosidase n=1 Tax=Natronosporangium hydrolyticum TaxID=2811111 RepID=A0A895YQV9_9ACTN|nr:glycoside hydrolase family 3 protein [Natronosporangium hydrolyticum]QSB16398.1 glycoside hydrolase family 3 C-terminal domain-containing protein [Natronosporangium hydrolyticum]
MTGDTAPTSRAAWAATQGRLRRLLDQLTTAEKIALLHQYQPAIDRLGLPAFRTGTEALHGLAWLGEATVFPQAIGLASSWDPELVETVGNAVADEVRGFHHKDPSRGSLNVWAPVVNPLRDPRWGRNEEGYSEDPWLTAIMGTAYASGLRGGHPEYLKTAPTLKHFLGYNNETDRDTTSSNLPPRVLREYELPAYQRPIATGAAVAVMAAYNLVNGRPAHLTPLINQELRRWSEQPLVVVSDAEAPSNLVDPQHYVDDHPAAHAAALRAGLDSFTDHGEDSQVTIGRLTEAYERGLLDESDLDRAVSRLLQLRIRLGELDPDADPYASITEQVINCPEHQQLARHAARRGIVLLTHRGLLPLRRDRDRTVAVIGPLADTLHTDWYSGTLPYQVTVRDGLAQRLGAEAVRWCEGVDRVAFRVRGTDHYLLAAESPGSAPIAAGPAGAGNASHLDLFDWGGGSCALRAAANQAHLRVNEAAELVNDSAGPGEWVVRETFRLVEKAGGEVALRHLATGRYLRADPDGQVRVDAADLNDATGLMVELVESAAATAAQLAAEADVAVVVLGNHPMVNGRETEDRTDLNLPAAQEALLKAVHTANPNTVLVVTSSYPYALGWAAENLPAVLWSAHGGQEHGHALAEVLLGEAEPVGRLTQTWYRSAADLPDLLDYDIIGTDATYLYYRGEPVYPFGHGLSYTTFGYEQLALSASEVAADGTVTVSVEVVNTGDRPGEEVVQLYTHQLRSRVKQPLRALRGFARVRLDPGERTTVTLQLAARDLAFWDVTRGRFTVESARHRIMVGRSATDPALSAVLTVRGEQIPARPPQLAAIDYDEAHGVTICDQHPVDGDAIRAVEPAAWLEFRDVELASQPRRLRLRAANPTNAPATVTLRRDDPLAGELLATATVPVTPDRHSYVDLTVESAVPAPEPADLYLVFDDPGTIVAELGLEAA